MRYTYGCIGKTLKHSFSREIHRALAPSNDYELIELSSEELSRFATEHPFRAINVTIPYKEEILPYLYSIDEHARSIGAVNTVVNRDGRLYGYNTDFYGMGELLRHAGVSVKDKKVLILGTGGTAKTAYAVCQAEGACEVLRVSRTAREGAISYEEAHTCHRDAEVIINTTPVGMYPSIFDTPLDIAHFPRLCGVIDAIYNPLRTPLILAARERGIAAEGGLFMLVAQAVRASEIFLDVSYPEGTAQRIYERMVKDKENIVLIGMPASGKSTVGARLAERLGRELIDTDAEIVRRAEASIPAIFAERGEGGFRELESEVIRSLAARCGCVIATGGGAVLRDGNVRALRENGRLYFLDRSLSKLLPTNDRPLACDRAAIEARYRERYGIYRACADLTVAGDGTPEEVAAIIEGDRQA